MTRWLDTVGGTAVFFARGTAVFLARGTAVFLARGTAVFLARGTAVFRARMTAVGIGAGVQPVRASTSARWTVRICRPCRDSQPSSWSWQLGSLETM